MRKKISLFLIVAIMLSLFVLPGTSFESYAATNSVRLATITRPADIESFINTDQGVIFHTQKDRGEQLTIYSFSINERGWVIFETQKESFDYTWFRMPGYGSGKTNYVYRNSSLTSKVDKYKQIYISGEDYRHLYYLDQGTYYIASYDTFDEYIYGFFLPNSSVLSHALKKAGDSTYYSDTVTFTANIGTTSIVNKQVSINELGKSDIWENAETNAEDKYKITQNGEYTVKANFTDAEWENYPAMYSFAVYDIVKLPKVPKSPALKVATSGKKAIKITWNKISGIKKYELQYSTTKNFKKPVTKTYKSTQKSAKISKLKSKKKYYVRMRSYKVFGGKKIYSKWSKVKTITTK